MKSEKNLLRPLRYTFSSAVVDKLMQQHANSITKGRQEKNPHNINL